MFKKLVSLLCCTLMVLSVAAACAQGVTVTDMYGRTIALDSPATRIVALSAADCEILCALGAEPLLVARGEYCDYPVSIQSLPVLQSGANTNLEEILALAPQVVLMSDMAQAKEIVDLLEANGVRVVVSNADDIAGVYTAIRMIGALTAHQAEAEALIGDMQSTFDAIAQKQASFGKTVYFEVSPLQWGLWTAGKHTFMDELATLCGLTNSFANIEGWNAISEEQVLNCNPDIIVTIAMYGGEGTTPVEEIAGRAGWENLKAVQDGQIYNADSNAISRPGPRLKDAALELYGFLTNAPLQTEMK